MSSDVIYDLATSLLDGTVFEIVRELEEIQQILERDLLNRRMKVVNVQRGAQLNNSITMSPNFCPVFQQVKVPKRPRERPRCGRSIRASSWTWISA